MKHCNWFHRRNQFPKSFKFWNKLREFWSWPIHFIVWIGLWKLEFFKQAYWIIKFWIKSIHSIDWISLRKKIFSICFIFFSICSINENGYQFFFLQATKALQNCKKSTFLYTESVRDKIYFYEQAIRALKLSTVSIHFLDWNRLPNNQFI